MKGSKDQGPSGGLATHQGPAPLPQQPRLQAKPKGAGSRGVLPSNVRQIASPLAPRPPSAPQFRYPPQHYTTHPGQHHMDNSSAVGGHGLMIGTVDHSSDEQHDKLPSEFSDYGLFGTESPTSPMVGDCSFMPVTDDMYKTPDFKMRRRATSSSSLRSEISPYSDAARFVSPVSPIVEDTSPRFMVSLNIEMLSFTSFAVPPAMHIKVDKGFKPYHKLGCFICQKKNHFQISLTIFLPELPTYVSGPNKINDLVLLLYGVKAENPLVKIALVVSNKDRSKDKFKPISVDLTEERSLCVQRLHFSEPTANNMRKKGQPHPEQRFFYLVATIAAHVGESYYPIASYQSERIIVRASNPQQFGLEESSQLSSPSPSPMRSVSSPSPKTYRQVYKREDYSAADHDLHSLTSLLHNEIAEEHLDFDYDDTLADTFQTADYGAMAGSSSLQETHPYQAAGIPELDPTQYTTNMVPTTLPAHPAHVQQQESRSQDSSNIAGPGSNNGNVDTLSANSTSSPSGEHTHTRMQDHPDMPQMGSTSILQQALSPPPPGPQFGGQGGLRLRSKSVDPSLSSQPAAHPSSLLYAVQQEEGSEASLTKSNPADHHSTTGSESSSSGTGSGKDVIYLHGHLQISPVNVADERLKKHVVPADTLQSLNRILGVKLYSFTSPDDSKAGGMAQELSFIGQELADAIPDAVKSTGTVTLSDGSFINNVLAVNKERIFIENVAAVQELAASVCELYARLEKLEAVNRRLISAISESSSIEQLRERLELPRGGTHAQ